MAARRKRRIARRPVAREVKRYELPLGVKIIAVLFYMAAILFFLGGILCFFGASLVGLIGFPMIGKAAIAFIGFCLIILAVLNFFVGWGLLSKQNWARIIAIVLSLIGAIGSLTAFFSGFWNNIVSFLLYGVIAWYLMFDKEVNSVFK